MNFIIAEISRHYERRGTTKNITPFLIKSLTVALDVFNTINSSKNFMCEFSVLMALVSLNMLYFMRNIQYLWEVANATTPVPSGGRTFQVISLSAALRELWNA